MTDAALDLLANAFAARTCLQLVISQRRRNASGEFSKVIVRPVAIGGRELWQFTCHYPRRVTHENHESAAASRRARELLTSDFEQGALYTPTADYAIRACADGSFRVKSSPPTKSAVTAVHDRGKDYLIPEGVPCPFLAEIGVMTPAGQVRRAMHHKFRQINRFLELVQDVVPALPETGDLRIVDFGCGRSYLTFALYHLLTAVHGRSVRIVGLDRQSDVIRTCSELAVRLGYEGLEFREGEISEYASTGRVDLAVSLHACDTATDAALAQGVRWNCAAILAVPCCQHELAPVVKVEWFAPLSRHGILHERFAALATDALRAALLEVHGYAAQVIEFIDMEHTAKNERQCQQPGSKIS
jgi:SAM-dependent methyltransferase